MNTVPNGWHKGYLQGTQSLWVPTQDRYRPSRAEEFTWSAMTNSNNNPSPRVTPDIDLGSLMWSVVNGVSAWPAHDLF